MSRLVEQPNAKDAKAAQSAQREAAMDDPFSHSVIGAALEVQKVLGTGLLESAYAAALAIELQDRGLRFQREAAIAGMYKGREIGVAYRADFIIEDTLLVELKAIDGLTDLHRAQVLSYLRLSQLKLGLLLNFHEFPLAKGIQRVVNKL